MHHILSSTWDFTRKNKSMTKYWAVHQYKHCFVSYWHCMPSWTSCLLSLCTVLPNFYLWGHPVLNYKGHILGNDLLSKSCSILKLNHLSTMQLFIYIYIFVLFIQITDIGYFNMAGTGSTGHLLCFRGGGNLWFQSDLLCFQITLFVSRSTPVGKVFWWIVLFNSGFKHGFGDGLMTHRLALPWKRPLGYGQTRVVVFQNREITIFWQ